MIFQPAEEGGGGGREMCEDGMMDRWNIQEVYGMHNWPGKPVGSFSPSVLGRSLQRPINSTSRLKGAADMRPNRKRRLIPP